MYSLILHGKRFALSQKWRHLSFVVQNASAFSNSSSSVATSAALSPQDCQKSKNFTVSYLVHSLGFTTKLAESISREVRFEDKGNPDLVLSLCRSYGFTDSQISSIIRDYPKLLILDAKKSLAPKLQLLQSRGASSSELTEIVSTVPKILGMKENKSISRYYDFIKEIIEADKSSKFEKLCQSLPQGKQENKFRNVSVLRELGMPQKLLFSLLTSGSPPIYGKERFEESLKKIVEMGFDPTTAKFVKALRVFYQTSDKTIEEKVNVYKRLGFAEEDVWVIFKKWPPFLILSEEKIVQMFETLKTCGLNENEVLQVLKKYPEFMRISEQKILNLIETFIALGFSRDECVMVVKRFPMCFGLSEDTVKKKTDFLLKKMKWPLKAVISQPQVLGFSLEKRIVPRCNLIKALISKGLLGDRGSKLPPMRSVLEITDQHFLDSYVKKHIDKDLVAELMAIFTGICAS